MVVYTRYCELPIHWTLLISSAHNTTSTSFCVLQITTSVSAVFSWLFNSCSNNCLYFINAAIAVYTYQTTLNNTTILGQRLLWHWNKCARGTSATRWNVLCVSKSLMIAINKSCSSWQSRFSSPNFLNDGSISGSTLPSIRLIVRDVILCDHPVPIHRWSSLPKVLLSHHYSVHALCEDKRVGGKIGRAEAWDYIKLDGCEVKTYSSEL